MTKVKVCGLTRVEDAVMLNRHMPDFAGFIFAKSKRQIQPEKAREIAQQLDARISRVGIFVNCPIHQLISVVSEVDLDIIQLHADTSSTYFDQLKEALSIANLKDVKIWQRIPIPVDASSAEVVLDRIKDYPDLSSFDALLFDVYTSSSDGGSGYIFPWSIGCELIDCLPRNIPGVIIAGGIHPDNVKKAYKMFLPFAFDASTSLETDGYKDETKVAALINSIRQLDNEE